MNSDDISRKFLNLGIINGFLALVFTIPILVPPLCIATPPGLFGCKATMDVNWPGTWVLVAWLVFLGAGVGGTLFFGATYYLRGKLSGKTAVNKTLGWLHLVIYELGLLGATGMMAVIGYVGGRALAQGFGAAIASQDIADIIPALSSNPTSVLNDMAPVVEAVFIGLALLGALIGFISFWRMKPEAQQQPATS